jgi:cytochrome c oxidase subunit 2
MPKKSHAFPGEIGSISVKSLFFWGRAEQSLNERKQMIVLECLFLTIAPCDAAEPWQLGSQDAATPMMQGIIDLHHDIFFFLILILVFVLRILLRALWHFHYQKNPIPQRIVHGTTIEILRTIFPSIIPMFIAIPSFALLYSMDEVVVDPAITIKAIGHQWYRTYEYSDYNSSDEQSLTFDSYTIPEDDLELGQSRLLEVDNRVVVPANTHLRIIVTSADVPHSWAVPSSGVKCDAVPGRLNQISISVQREGVYYGQCSEICGTNHAFTPIVIEAVSLKDYAVWVKNQCCPQPGVWARAFDHFHLVLLTIAHCDDGTEESSASSVSQEEIWAALDRANPQQGDPASSADVGPSIPHIQERIKEFLSAFGKRKPSSRFLERISSDLGVETSSIQKRAKIISVIEELSHNRDFPPSGQNAAAKLTMLIEAWEKGK